MGVPIAMCNKATMRIEALFGTSHEASRFTGMKPSLITRMAKERMVPSGDYVFRLADDVDASESFDGKRNRPIRIEDVPTGRWAVYGDSAKAAEVLKVSSTYVTRCANKGWLCHGRLAISYQR